MRIENDAQHNLNTSLHMDIAKDKQNQAIGDAKNIKNSTENEAVKNDSLSGELRDEYIKSEDEPQKSADIYRVEKDENGKQNVVYEKSDLADKSNNDDRNITDECTTSTNKVDAEIKKLKTEKQKIEQQLRGTHDENKQKELENRLSTIRAELKIKDTDVYRKQHAKYTNK